MKVHKSTTVLVAKPLTSLYQRTTTVGTVARVVATKPTAKGQILPKGWLVIETMEHPARFWTVHPSDVVKAPRPWSWYQGVHEGGNEQELEALATAQPSTEEPKATASTAPTADTEGADEQGGN